QLGAVTERTGLLEAGLHGAEHRVGCRARRTRGLDGSVRDGSRFHAAAADRGDSAEEPVDAGANAGGDTPDTGDLSQSRRGALHVLRPEPVASGLAAGRDPPALRPTGDAGPPARAHAERDHAGLDRLAARLAGRLVR